MKKAVKIVLIALLVLYALGISIFVGLNWSKLMPSDVDPGDQTPSQVSNEGGQDEETEEEEKRNDSISDRQKVVAEIDMYVGVDENGQELYKTIRLSSLAPLGTKVVDDPEHALAVFEPKCFVKGDAKLCVYTVHEAYPADFSRYTQLGVNAQFGTLYKVYLKDVNDHYSYTNKAPRTTKEGCSDESGFTSRPPCGDSIIGIGQYEYFMADCHSGEDFCDGIMQEMRAKVID